MLTALLKDIFLGRKIPLETERGCKENEVMLQQKLTQRKIHQLVTSATSMQLLPFL